MTRSLQLACATAAVGLMAACDKDSSPIKTTSSGETNLSPPADSIAARGLSMVRVVNAVDGGTDVTVALGDSTLFAGVKPASVTDYREVSANLASFSVRAPGGLAGTSLAKNDELLMDGNRYTIVLIAEDMATTTLRVLKDEVIPDSGKARLRVIHAAPGAPSLDVRVVGQKENLFSDVSFKSEAGYNDVLPPRSRLELRAKNEPTVLLRIRGLELKRGTSTTIVVTGGTTLKSFRFTDALQAPTPTP
ncbi:MAG: DUF4397 domain-containing protein [Gemmatimonadetes bacterium]|nr:DUF4397 domain-containing protein [Gemmatimonadota bacterium]